LSLFFADIDLPAQDIAGTITYQQITKLDFTTVFDAEAMVRVTNYFGGELPEATTAHKILSFTSTSSLFKNSSIAESVDPKMQRLTMHLDVMRPPRPKLEKLYFDFEKDEKVEQVDFMTRTFCIVDEIKNPAWKLTNKSTKILNYSCTSAELKKVMISFSPISPLKFPSPLVRMNSLVCPDSFSLLRKMVKPTPLELKALDNNAISRPLEGKRVTQEEFNIILKDKVVEYEETRSNEPRDHDRR